jgi:hypothetical protein
MNPTNPPRIATWMMEHLAPTGSDEAIAGDLLEHFRAGRPDGWYWRQVFGACCLSWSRSLAARGPALVFALAWSLLAPAWQAIVDGIVSNPLFDRMWHILGPFWLPFMVAGWVLLHAAFLWAGILAYQFAHSLVGKALRPKDLRRAFWLSALVLPPVAAATYVVAHIYWYSWPGLAHARLAATSLRQIADMGILANIIRVPYFVALVCALWQVIPPSLRERHGLPSSFDSGPRSVESHDIAGTATPDPFTVRRFLAFMVGAGLVNAMIAGFLLCQLPQSTTSDLGSLLARSICYLALAVSAGALGAYAYWQCPWSPFQEKPPLPFPLFALVCASGWVWVPAMAIFCESLSAGAALVAMIGAFVLAAGLRNVTWSVLAPATSGSAASTYGAMDLFQEALYRPPADFTGYVIALCIALAVLALATRSIFTGTMLLALAAAVFAWKRTLPRSSETTDQYRRAAWRVALVLIPAILITLWSLLGGIANRNRVAKSAGSVAAAENSAASPATHRKSRIQTVAYGPGGYISVILWPYPEKKPAIPPIMVPDSLLAPGTKRPFIIRFNGPYTYVQPPEKLPGPDAHQARGTPIDADIESNNDIPVVMTAHQYISAPIRVDRCGEIDVEIANRDNRAGQIALALLLTDADSAERRTAYLGQQPIVSTLPDHFSVKTEPVFETLRFTVPAGSPLRDFNELTVMMLPDIEHRYVAPRIAIEQFQLYPR